MIVITTSRSNPLIYYTIFYSSLSGQNSGPVLIAEMDVVIWASKVLGSPDFVNSFSPTLIGNIVACKESYYYF